MTPEFLKAVIESEVERLNSIKGLKASVEIKHTDKNLLKFPIEYSLSVSINEKEVDEAKANAEVERSKTAIEKVEKLVMENFVQNTIEFLLEAAFASRGF